MLAWCILPVIVVTAAVTGSAGQAQANIRIASNTNGNSNSSSTGSSTSSNSSSGSGRGGRGVAAAGTLGVAAGPAARYVVQPGDTLAGIAAGLGVRGGWPALYAANRAVIGPDPDVVRPGAVLVLPGQAPVRYRVAAGDTLAAIAAGLGVRGGWPALYAVNRAVIGPDPGVIRPGMMLRVPSPAAPSPAGPSPAGSNPVRPSSPPPAAAGVAGGGHRPGPARAGGPAGAGMPRWLTTVLLAAGLLTGAAFLAEPVLMLRRRRRTARRRLPVSGPVPVSGPGPVHACGLVPGVVPGRGRFGGGRGRVVLADFDRVVVTHSAADDTVYVLRPPGEDPEVILRAARLVLHEGPYRQLAGALGLPASWPVVLADYGRLVVTHSRDDDAVYVLRPPGQDPAAILRAARLVLPEGPYGELADQLGVPAGLPIP